MSKKEKIIQILCRIQQFQAKNCTRSMVPNGSYHTAYTYVLQNKSLCHDKVLSKHTKAQTICENHQISILNAQVLCPEPICTGNYPQRPLVPTYGILVKFSTSIDQFRFSPRYLFLGPKSSKVLQNTWEMYINTTNSLKKS